MPGAVLRHLKGAMDIGDHYNGQHIAFCDSVIVTARNRKSITGDIVQYGDARIA